MFYGASTYFRLIELGLARWIDGGNTITPLALGRAVLAVLDAQPSAPEQAAPSQGYAVDGPRPRRFVVDGITSKDTSEAATLKEAREAADLWRDAFGGTVRELAGAPPPVAPEPQPGSRWTHTDRAGVWTAMAERLRPDHLRPDGVAMVDEKGQKMAYLTPSKWRFVDDGAGAPVAPPPPLDALIDALDGAAPPSERPATPAEPPHLENFVDLARHLGIKAEAVDGAAADLESLRADRALLRAWGEALSAPIHAKAGHGAAMRARSRSGPSPSPPRAAPRKLRTMTTSVKAIVRLTIEVPVSRRRGLPTTMARIKQALESAEQQLRVGRLAIRGMVSNMHSDAPCVHARVLDVKVTAVLASEERRVNICGSRACAGRGDVSGLQALRSAGLDETTWSHVRLRAVRERSAKGAFARRTFDHVARVEADVAR